MTAVVRLADGTGRLPLSLRFFYRGGEAPPAKFLNYCDLWNRKAMPYTIDDAESSFNKSPLPGVKVMKSLRQVLKTNASQAIKMELLFKTKVEFLHDSGWRWTRFGLCGTPLLLDTAPQDQECQAFAVELMQLRIAPWPFGIGLPVAEVNMRTYIGPLLASVPFWVQIEPASWRGVRRIECWA
jgi:hypothetical protein